MTKRKQLPATPEQHGLTALLPDVTPLPPLNRARLETPRPPPVPGQRLLDEREVLRESLDTGADWDYGIDTGEELSYLRPGMPTLTLRKLRRGHWKTQAELDLHGCNSVQARIQLVDFIAYCKLQGARCVRIIHGKGLGSKNREPVLKRKVAHWLMQRDDVLAFAQARRTEGGSGAVVVLLKAG